MNTEQLAKLRARANTLLDLFIALREKYSLLRPIAFDEDLVKRWRKGPAAHGFLTLRNMLLTGCVQDIVKLTLDSDDRVPSIRNIMATLEDENVRNRLRTEFAKEPPAPSPPTDDPDVLRALEKIAEKEEAARRRRFDGTWEQLVTLWSSLAGRKQLNAFKTWRDKLIAHSDLHHNDGEYKLLDLKELDLQWGDIGGVLDQLQEVVQSINLLVRDSHFAFDMLDRQLGEAASGFWGAHGWTSDSEDTA